MSRTSSRRQKKAKERERKKRKQATARRAKESYPSITLANTNAPAPLIAAFRKTLREFRLSDSSLFSTQQRRFFRAQHSQGFKMALKTRHGIALESWDLAKEAREHMKSCDSLDKLVLCIAATVGAALLEATPAMQRYIPSVSFSVEPTLPYGEDWEVTFSSLKHKARPKGQIFYPQAEYTATIRGVTKRVAYTKHAMARVCDRVITDWQTYAGLGDAHAIFQCCTHFEPTTIIDKGLEQLGASIYYPCIRNMRTWSVIEYLLDGNTEDDKFYYWRIGYLPLSITDEFWVAKTMLLPGFRGTPEHRLVKASKSITKKEKQDLFAEIDKGARADLSVVKWFHKNGIPQVLASDKRLFDLDAGFSSEKRAS